MDEKLKESLEYLKNYCIKIQNPLRGYACNFCSIKKSCIKYISSEIDGEGTLESFCKSAIKDLELQNCS